MALHGFGHYHEAYERTDGYHEAYERTDGDWRIKTLAITRLHVLID